MDRKALRPEPIQGYSRTRKVLVVREQQPESEDGLGQKVEHSISDDFAVDTRDAGALGHAPDTKFKFISVDYNQSPDILDLHGIDGPYEQGEERECPEEGLGASIFTRHRVVSLVRELVDDGQVANAGDSEPTPFLDAGVAEGGEEAAEDHDHIARDDHRDAVAA